VFDLVFPDLDKEAANHLWEAQLSKPAKESKAPEDDDD
jgi:hypothetical protein